MTTKETSVKKRRSPPPLTRDEQPLLRALVAEATRRGDTLAELAKALGVTYERLAQWRRGDAEISRATRSVHEKAAKYLGLPTVLILVMSGLAGLSDFVWPDKDSLRDRVTREIERLRQDPYIGAFVPAELAGAEPAVKLFVTFLFHELESGAGPGRSSARWLHALHQAAAGNVEGQLKLDVLRKQSLDSPSIF